MSDIVCVGAAYIYLAQDKLPCLLIVIWCALRMNVRNLCENKYKSKFKYMEQRNVVATMRGVSIRLK